jgi:tRNA(adenine34) deaminase
MKTLAILPGILLLILISPVSAIADPPGPPSPQKPDSYSPYMSELIEEAHQSHGLPFKAMIIDNRNGRILCRGSNSSRTNPLLHGEIDAINNCVDLYGNKMPWKNSTLISTAEPCPMCTGAIIWSRIPIIVYGSSIPDLIAKGWSQINMRAYEVAKHSQLGKPLIIGGVLKEQTDALFPVRNSQTGHRPTKR